MNVGQLKKELDKHPDDMDVFIDERLTEFRYGLLNGVTKKEINFMGEPNGESLSKDTVVILGED
jgi:hypothetical protein